MLVKVYLKSQTKLKVRCIYTLPGRSIVNSFELCLYFYLVEPQDLCNIFPLHRGIRKFPALLF